MYIIYRPVRGGGKASLIDLPFVKPKAFFIFPYQNLNKISYQEGGENKVILQLKRVNLSQNFIEKIKLY